MATQPQIISPKSADPVWTGPQRQAIEHRGGDLLISAAAGSGKTAVLAERCARLVCDFNPGAPLHARTSVENLLVVTFTEAAAGEMKTRIAAAIQKKRAAIAGKTSTGRDWLSRQAALIDRAAISTLHGFCARLLRQYFHQASLDPAFEIMNEDEARLLREEVLDELLVRWHGLADSEAGAAFADFLDAYAGGRESHCRDLILSLHGMLATVADPEQFKATARRAYAAGPDGASATLDAYLRETLGGRLRLAEMSAERSVEQVRQFAAHNDCAASLLKKLRAAYATVRSARGSLEKNGCNGWAAAQAEMNSELPELKRGRTPDDYKALKKRTWDRLEGRLKSLRDDLAGDPENMLSDLLSLSRPLETLLVLADEFSSAYTAAKRSENRLDFADLERLALELLAAPGGQAAGELRRRFHHVLVDEFQDINPLQGALLVALRNPAAFGGSGNLFAVGDVKQSIYSFRHADPGLFLARERAAREARRNGYLALPHNFRSRPALIAAMNAIFSRLLTQEVAGIDYAKGHRLEPAPACRPAPAESGTAEAIPIEVHLWAMKAGTGADADEPPEPEPDQERDEGGEELKENLSAFDFEARMVADRIAQLLAEKPLVKGRDGSERPLACRDIAILLRSVKNRAMIFVRALAGRAIPVHADLSTGFFDSPEIRDVLSLLHLLDNQDQDIPLAATLLGPFGHFSHDDLARIRLAFDRRDTPFHRAAARYAGAETGGADAALADGISPELTAGLREFCARMDRWRGIFRTQPLHEALAAVFGESKFFIYLSGLEAAAQRIANVRMLSQRALDFSGFRRQGLHRFLRFIERLSRDQHDTGEAAVLSEASDVVRVMSVHKSKGLEFPVVFVSALGGQFNRRESGPVLIHRNLGVGLAVIDTAAAAQYPSAAQERIRDQERRLQTAEELRLLYVAMTRARERLFLTGHVAGETVLETCREEWSGHAGPLPEDQLLKARCPLDFVLPAICSGAGAGESMAVCWDGEDPAADMLIAVRVHGAGETQAAAESSGDSAAAPAYDSATENRDEGSSPPAAASDSPAAAALISRITALYPFARQAQQPAVQTVTFLKTQSAEGDEDEAPAVPVAALSQVFAHAGGDPARALAARERGIATHRVLELLDFPACDSPAAFELEIQRLLHAGRLSAAENAAADQAGIRWFLFESAAGRRLRGAAQKIAAGDSTIRILRELPFTWTPPAEFQVSSFKFQESPPLETRHSKLETQDSPTIRGVIDLLLVEDRAGSSSRNRTAEILDYKTDSEFTWQANLEDYRRQMRYYLAAAYDILDFPVRTATLIFLSPREAITVNA